MKLSKGKINKLLLLKNQTRKKYLCSHLKTLKNNTRNLSKNKNIDFRKKTIKNFIL